MKKHKRNLKLFLNGEAMVKIKNKKQFENLIKIIEEGGGIVRKDYKNYKKRKKVMYYLVDCIGDLVYVRHNKRARELVTPTNQQFVILKLKELKGE